ncbi:uncharacterized protein LOC131672252 isoform X1 [Phymastichus coffea]|uniref:uncharacterized protein LOC131672252 isoform X1 n=1 Tax=Phymastichus coffea TaxID=108790 RepID=UPI00273CDAFD|nr:uncharacterized protein LOC131672252 isoform X1 [Phymastichus coffea]
MRNVEIKAKVDNIDEVEKKAIELSDTPLKVINQHDIFFHIPVKQATNGGRLKLREFEDDTGELIYYERPDIQGPKLSNYTKVYLDSDRRKNLREVLTQSNGILGTVEKTRHLYLVGQTRIHIDRVLGLGNFMELEVALDYGDDPAKGEEIAKKLMKELGVSDSSLLSGAYLDMVLKK